MKPLFIQIHTLTTYPAGLKNRDNNGLAKRIGYGDAVRERMSSQCQKYAWRTRLFDTTADGALVPLSMADLAERVGLAMSVRSRLIFDRCIVPALTKGGMSEADAVAWANAAAALFTTKTQADENRANGDEDEDGDDETATKKAPIVLGRVEIDAIVETIRLLADKGLPAHPSVLIEAVEGKPRAEKGAKKGKAATDAAAPSKVPQEIKNAVKEQLANLRALKAHAGLDGALFGRMITASIGSRVDAAVLVAHAFSVSAIEADVDFFSVVDDLKTLDEDDAGASHTNTTELTSGIMIGYAVIDVAKLAENLFAGTDPESTAAVAAWLVESFAQLAPAAKRGSTAAIAHAYATVVEIGTAQPRTLAGAFHRALPRSREDMQEKALVRLMDHARQMDGLHGRPQTRLLATLEDYRKHATSGTTSVALASASLSEASEAVRSAVLAHAAGAVRKGEVA